MRRLTKYINAIKYSHYVAMLTTALLLFLCMPGLRSASTQEAGSNLVSVFINGTQAGTVKDAAAVDRLLLEARKRVAKEYNGLVLIPSDVVLSGSKDLIGVVDDDETIIENICKIYNDSIMKTKQAAYEVKINQFTVNLRSIDDVHKLLDAAKNEYDVNNDWTVNIVTDPTRELNVLTTSVSKTNPDDLVDDIIKIRPTFPVGGAILQMEQIYNKAYLGLNDRIKVGLKNLDFNENVEIVQAYVDSDKISTVEEAIEMVTKTKEKEKIYEVVSGDTLGLVAQKNDMKVADILKLNPETIPNENTMLRVGDEIKVASPEPELSVIRTEIAYYPESYNEEVIYEDVPEWYTNHQEVKREAITGFRRIIAEQTYRNSELTGRNVLYENVEIKAVAKIIRRGTQPPPTYMKPVSGGRLSSRFGRRKAPTKGASTYHKGVDFAVPVGTAVAASSDGTVIRAGWGSGYGYCVYIQHPNGTVTRYGHLSKVLVKNGQSVKQGEKIALSGNTGVSSGPHLHFEILINGVQVNPLNYI